MGSSGKKKRKPKQADLADRHALYEASVQNAEAECEFIAETFRQLRGRPARVFREDFCGTANICSHWVRQHRENLAIGVDLDPEVLEWGRRHRIEPLKPQARERVRLLQRDVLKVRSGPVDAVGAFNFSYWIFTTRALMKRYFRAVHRTMVDDGVFFLDAFGGYDAFRELEEARKLDGFTYIWDQAEYYPVTGEMTCHIHFKFPDGSRMNRAFSYHWRLWSLPELTELLTESGFGRVTVYWEGTDEEGEGNGVFAPETRGEPDAGWIAYIVAEK
ncbi:MAG: class I SAM-dependent methyltransferase [Chromatiales bacterium]|nr:class I SAM-dependent methyltransferase [Chromatiales bacterium]